MRYTLTASNPASNPDAVPEFNVSARDVLPVGVTYNPGSSTPVGFGEPQVITDPDTGQQTLIWSNVADIAPGSTGSLSFSATLSAATFPVGSEAINNADVYTNSDPRVVPKFTATGEPVPGSFTETASDLASTRVSAVHLDKVEPSPEGELLRGVHDHTTVYTLTVTNNHGAATNGAGVVDLIPAGLEFLGCGQSGQLHDRAGVPHCAVAGRDAAGDAELSDARLGEHRHRPAGRSGRRLHPRRLDARQPRARPGGDDPVRRRHPAARQHHHLPRPQSPPRPASARRPTSTTTPVRPPARPPSSRPTPTTRRSPAPTPARSRPAPTPRSARPTPRPSRSEDVRMRKSSATRNFVEDGVQRYTLDHRHQRVRRRLRHRGHRPPPQRHLPARRRAATTSPAHPPTAILRLPSRPRGRRSPTSCRTPTAPST